MNTANFTDNLKSNVITYSLRTIVRASELLRKYATFSRVGQICRDSKLNLVRGESDKIVIG